MIDVFNKILAALNRAPLGWEACTLQTEQSSILYMSIMCPHLKQKNRAQVKNLENVSRLMLTEPKKYSSCNTENKPRNISRYFSKSF